MRAIKRKKNEVKELARLKKTVGSSKQDASCMIQDVIMNDLVVGNLLFIIIILVLVHQMFMVVWNKILQHAVYDKCLCAL